MEEESMGTWKEFRDSLEITPEDERVIEFEKDLIRTLIEIREEQGLTQASLARKCNMKQPVIARLESATHSPQIDSLLKVLVPLGYTLKIMPINGSAS